MADSSIDALIAQVEAEANGKDAIASGKAMAMSAATKARLLADLTKAKATAKVATKAYQNTSASAANYAQVKAANDSAINAINNIQDQLDKNVEPKVQAPSVAPASDINKKQYTPAQMASFSYAQTLQQTAEQEYNDFKVKLQVFSRGAANSGDKAELERLGKDYQSTMTAIKSAYEKAGVVQGDVTLDQNGKLIEGTKFVDPTKPSVGTQVVSKGTSVPVTTGAIDSQNQEQQNAIPITTPIVKIGSGGNNAVGSGADSASGLAFVDAPAGFQNDGVKLAGPETPELLKQEQQNFVSKYGGIAAMALAHPWMTTILNQAIAQGWTGDKFTQTIQADPNWKNFDQHLRDYETAFYGNNQAWAEEYNKQLVLLQNSAKAQGYDPSIFGAAIDTSNAANIQAAKDGTGVVNQYLKAFYGTGVPDQATFDRFVANHATMAKQLDGTPEGALATSAASIRKYFQSMGINTMTLPSTWTGADETGASHTISSSGDYATNLADAVQKGFVNMDTVQQTARDQAAGIYKPFAEQIKNGVSVATLAQPYTSAAAQLLEKDPSSFTIGDYTGINGKLTKALTGDGTNTIPLDQWMTTLKQTPDWLQTTNARNSMMDTANSLLRSFGMVVG